MKRTHREKKQSRDTRVGINRDLNAAILKLPTPSLRPSASRKARCPPHLGMNAHIQLPDYTGASAPPASYSALPRGLSSQCLLPWYTFLSISSPRPLGLFPRKKTSNLPPTHPPCPTLPNPFELSLERARLTLLRVQRAKTKADWSIEKRTCDTRTRGRLWSTNRFEYPSTKTTTRAP